MFCEQEHNKAFQNIATAVACTLELIKFEPSNSVYYSQHRFDYHQGCPNTCLFEETFLKTV